MRNVQNVIGSLLALVILTSCSKNENQAQTNTQTTHSATTDTAHTGPAHIMLTAAEFQWGDGPNSLPPGSKRAVLEGDPSKVGPFTMRVILPAGWLIRPHSHPEAEHVTVISGNFAMGTGDVWDSTSLKDLLPGGYAVMAKGSTHFALAREDCVIQLHGVGPWGIMYVNPADDPRNKMSQKL